MDRSRLYDVITIGGGIRYRIPPDGSHETGFVRRYQERTGFPDLQKCYKTMSVPCLVMNDDQVVFGKKNIGQILSLIN